LKKGLELLIPLWYNILEFGSVVTYDVAQITVLCRHLRTDSPLPLGMNIG